MRFNLNDVSGKSVRKRSSVRFVDCYSQAYDKPIFGQSLQRKASKKKFENLLKKF